MSKMKDYIIDNPFERISGTDKPKEDPYAEKKCVDCGIPASEVSRPFANSAFSNDGYCRSCFNGTHSWNGKYYELNTSIT